MHADIQGALNQLNKSYKAFTHKGNRMSKSDVKKVLQYALSRGYKSTSELTDSEVDDVLNARSQP